LQGRVDLASHLGKTEEKFAKAKDKLSKLQEQMSAAGYKDKVDAEIREADDERLRNLSVEVDTLDSFVSSLRKLTIG
jgi:valyl-tRNA synthetase